MTSTLLPFLISLVAAGHVVVATGVWNLPVVTVTLAIAAGLTNASLSDGKAPRLNESGFTRMVQLWAAYGVMLAMALVMLSTRGDNEYLIAARILVALQVLVLGLRGAGHSSLPVFVNAQALVCLVALVGGIFASIAITLCTVLTVLWMVLQTYERNRASLERGFLAAIPYCLVTAIVLGAWFAVAPPPHVGVIAFGEFSPAQEAALREAYKDLFIWAIGALLLMTVMRRALRKKDKKKPEKLEEESVEVGFDRIESLDEGGLSDVLAVSGARAKLLECYMRFLGNAAERDKRREPSATPLEFAKELPGPAVRLATLFGRARYSEQPVVDADVADAEESAKAVLDQLKR